MRFGDLILQLVAGAAAFGVVVIVGVIAYKLVDGARLSISTFGLGFLVHQNTWDITNGHFAAGNFIYGTAVAGFGALVLATPLALGIAIYLSELAPRWIAGPVTALIETLAAIPSVILGFWGLYVLAPFLLSDVDPALHSALGFIPLFGTATSGSNLFTAIVVLTIMVIPIISSVSRELFLGVPTELKEGALGLGTTRWEVIRGVVLPYSRSGIAAATILGLGRAIGEAIAVLLVAGGGTQISANLFQSGNTIAARIASEFQGAQTALELASIFYLAVILLVFSFVVNLVARLIIRRSARRLGTA
ncbi:MAG TPA: phosphate ABC transporter permease subunit PstC [Gaiellaceae bacterium]